MIYRCHLAIDKAYINVTHDLIGVNTFCWVGSEGGMYL